MGEWVRKKKQRMGVEKELKNGEWIESCPKQTEAFVQVSLVLKVAVMPSCGAQPAHARGAAESAPVAPRAT